MLIYCISPLTQVIFMDQAGGRISLLILISELMQWGVGKGQKCLTCRGSLCLTSDLQKMWIDFQVSYGAETTAYHVI